MDIIVKINNTDCTFKLNEDDNILDKLLYILEDELKINKNFFYLNAVSENTRYSFSQTDICTR